MKQTVYSTDPKPFIKNGSFVRVHEDENISSWGVVVDNRIVYQDGGFDRVDPILPEKVIPEIRKGRAWSKSYIEAVVNAPYGFDDLDKEVFDWEYREAEPMPELKTGMFVYVRFKNPELGGYGVVVGNDIIYQKGGWDKVNAFNAQTGKNKSYYSFSKITAVVWGEWVHTFNHAKNAIENGKENYSGANLWRSQD